MHMQMTPEDTDETQPDETLPEVLTEQQAARAVALALAKDLLTGQPALMKGLEPPEVWDLTQLASWILEGPEDPPESPYPSWKPGGVVVLAPGVEADGDTITWGDRVYIHAYDDSKGGERG